MKSLKRERTLRGLVIREAEQMGVTEELLLGTARLLDVQHNMGAQFGGIHNS